MLLRFAGLPERLKQYRQIGMHHGVARAGAHRLAQRAFGFGVTARDLQQQAEPAQHRTMTGMQRQYAAVAGLRFIEAMTIMKQQAEIDARVHVLGVNLDGSPVAMLRLAGIPFVFEQNAEIVQCLGVIRVKRKRRPVMPRCIRCLPGMMRGDTC